MRDYYPTTGLVDLPEIAHYKQGYQFDFGIYERFDREHVKPNPIMDAAIREAKESAVQRWEREYRALGGEL
jgi:hypothetical protein